MLTIAIPTFNRSHLLRGCLERLLPQMTSHHQLLIVDNCSDVPVQDYLGGWLNDHGEKNIRIVRNSINVGSGANLLRCLELCETSWLYCLGDDDLVADDCIQKIESALANYPEALYISFSREVARRPCVTRARGLKEFIANLDDWSSFLFMSSSIVNAGKMRPVARWGYLYAYTWAPFQAILLKLLNSEGEVVFSDEIICHEESLSDDTWIPFPVAAGKMLLPELIDGKELRRALAAKLMAKPSSIALVYLARATSEDWTTLERNRFFVQLYLRRCVDYVGIRNGIRLAIARFLGCVMLRPSLLPNIAFRMIESAAFYLMNRKIPLVKPMSDDRA
ncbi:MAG: glycosyltransferase family 2 protein [Gallionellaceae bacterium]